MTHGEIQVLQQHYPSAQWSSRQTLEKADPTAAFSQTAVSSALGVSYWPKECERGVQ